MERGGEWKGGEMEERRREWGWGSGDENRERKMGAEIKKKVVAGV